MNTAKPPLTVAVLQSNYLPWKGYFDFIHEVDLFVFYDDVQFTTNDWRNRNRIPTANGLTWLTVPVGAAIDRLICEVVIPDARWQRKHWMTLQQSYAGTPGLALYGEFFRHVYEDNRWQSLSELNQSLIRGIAGLLDIHTRFDDSRHYCLHGHKQERLLDLLQQLGATRYISGPAGRNYIEEEGFREAGIELAYKSYSGYPEYRQRHGHPFEHAVSVVDLLFNTGADAAHHVYGWRTAGTASTT